MDILFLCHCVPNPPDKGEKIRAHQELLHVAQRHRVHLICFARNQADLAAAAELQSICASVHAEPLHASAALARAGVRFVLGGCLMTAFYGSRAIRRRVTELRRSTRLGAAVVYSSAMAPYAPPDVPLLLDMVDVDSEKWLQYAATRFPGFAYRAEGRRLRAVERSAAARSVCTLLATAAEEKLLRGFAGDARTGFLENGVDFSYFDPSSGDTLPELEGRRAIAFIGGMDYFPNADGAVRFATRVFPRLRAADPLLELWVVGRNPAKAVRRLGDTPGIRVTGSVPDVRPYLRAASLTVAPLAIARGIQNKVLEALAMGKPALASEAVCATFGPALPAGVIPCRTEEDYAAALTRHALAPGGWDESIRAAARARFSWERNLAVLDAELSSAVGAEAIG